MKAVHMPVDTPDQHAERDAALESAARKTIEAPVETSAMAVAVLRLAVEAAASANVNAISDAATSAALACAALKGASLNVRINCPNLKDREAAQAYLARIRQLKEEADSLEEKLEGILAARGNLAGD